MGTASSTVDWRYLAAAGAVAGVASGVAYFYTRGHPPPPPPPAEQQEEEEESSSSDSSADNEAPPGDLLFGYGGSPTPSLLAFFQEYFEDRAPPANHAGDSPQEDLWFT